ncbi:MULTISPECIES: TetR/AcrR family transcriptional regulator [Thioclava]|uniref:TetR/AcrR family transcriptional regulator n=1 Tax=Thioclava TaxID=285107 RepID=UPI0023A7DA54|nr:MULTISPECIES: TetR/AcrR family transcriptional regulator [Thioclava]|tara:strand:- start:1297 stop:2058 length:762 start_codon:yes stop_codon:yes gene_type:complete
MYEPEVVASGVGMNNKGCQGENVQAKPKMTEGSSKTNGAGNKPGSPQGAVRMPFNERRAQILDVATEFFAENGLAGQTRQLAEKCGISQRLLYRFFPTKEDLLKEVYNREILGAFKAVWFVELQDRSQPMAVRLDAFYRDYLQSTLTRKWLRLFLYASLAEANMAPDYIAAIVMQLLETVMREVAHERGVELPEDPALLREMAWTLHGAISHYAIRRHIYQSSLSLSEDQVVTMHVRVFLAGFEDMVEVCSSR